MKETLDLVADPSAIHIPIPTDQTVWAELDSKLGVRDRCKGDRNNVYYRRETPGSNFGPIIVRYHETDIVTASLDGSVKLNSGGWRTYTTKERLNDYLPSFSFNDVELAHGGRNPLCSVSMNLYSEKGTWKMGRVVRHGVEYFHEEGPDFFDGMILGANGMLVTPSINCRNPHPSFLACIDCQEQKLGHLDRDDSAILKSIDDYVALYTDEKINELVTDARKPMGLLGDCLICRVKDEDGNPVPDNSHYYSHLEEGYVMASVILTAVEARNYGNPAFIISMAVDGRDTSHWCQSIRKDIRRFLRQRLATNTSGARPTGTLQKDWYK